MPPWDKRPAAVCPQSLADQVIPAQLKQRLLCPPQSNILETEIKTATRVARVVFESDLSRIARPADYEASIRSHVYKPEYRSLAYMGVQAKPKSVFGEAGETPEPGWVAWDSLRFFCSALGPEPIRNGRDSDDKRHCSSTSKQSPDCPDRCCISGEVASFWPEEPGYELR